MKTKPEKPKLQAGYNDNDLSTFVGRLARAYNVLERKFEDLVCYGEGKPPPCRADQAPRN